MRSSASIPNLNLALTQRIDNTELLKQVAVAAAPSYNEIWGVNASGAIHRFNYSTKAFTQIPSILAQIAVGEGDQDKCHPYEVWV